MLGHPHQRAINEISGGRDGLGVGLALPLSQPQDRQERQEASPQQHIAGNDHQPCGDRNQISQGVRDGLSVAQARPLAQPGFTPKPEE